MRRTVLSVLTGATLAAALVASPATAAPPDGVGEETLGNNLSVPTIFVPDTGGAPALRLPCPSDAVQPGWDGTPESTQFPGYWLQKTEATWTAACAEAESATVTAQWGANLTDAPNLAAGKPIRVEVSLLDPDASGMTGYTITNLTPELPDRLATYGTDGTTFSSGVDGAPGTRVWAPGTSLKIQELDANGLPTDTIYDGPITAEINSTGAVVYGFNWGSKGRRNTPSPGTYLLTFSIGGSAVTIDDVVAGTLRIPTIGAEGHSTSIEITLTAANRGGGHGRGGGGGGQGGGGGH